MKQPTQCPKCQSPMEEGFVVDRKKAASVPATWIAGPPENSFWTGVKMRGRRQRQIASYRCVQCGYLENYAW